MLCNGFNDSDYEVEELRKRRVRKGGDGDSKKEAAKKWNSVWDDVGMHVCLGMWQRVVSQGLISAAARGEMESIK